MTREIKLTRGMVALVDDEDFEIVNQFKWHVVFPETKHGYAARHYRNKDGEKKYMYLHRFIMDPPSNMCVDHIDGNGLNCVRDNMRICTQQQNVVNKRAQSKYRGVHWSKNDCKWEACIQINRRKKFIGLFHSIDDAAKYYDAAARFYFGEFAKTNLDGDLCLSIEQIHHIVRKNWLNRNPMRYIYKNGNRWTVKIPKYGCIGNFGTVEQATIVRNKTINTKCND